MTDTISEWTDEFIGKITKMSELSVNATGHMLVDTLHDSEKDERKLRLHKQSLVATVIAHNRRFLPDVEPNILEALASKDHPKVQNVVLEAVEDFLRGFKYGLGVTPPQNMVAMIKILERAGKDPAAIIGKPRNTTPETPDERSRRRAARQRAAKSRGPKSSGPRQ